MSTALEPDRTTRSLWAKHILGFMDDFIDGLPDAPSRADLSADGAVVDSFAAGPGRDGSPLPVLVERIRVAADLAAETAGPGCFAYFPPGGLYSSVLGEALAQTVNRYTGVASVAPAMVALEQSVLRWFCDEFGLPDGSGGLITSGTSIATLAAVHAACEARLRRPERRGTVYVTEHTHHSVAKAARIAGLGDDSLRLVPVDGEHRMDTEAATEMIRADRAAGSRPFLVVGTAGSTNTGTLDPLERVAELAEREGLWYHVDAAYGGGFQLTERGRRMLRGIDRADSIAFDPHKSLFLPYGTGVLLVRDRELLRAAHGADGEYLQDITHDDRLPDFADLGPELTRDSRGLRLWLPLQLHGTDAFRSALDEKLDLARWAYDALRGDPNLALPPRRPDLTVIVFRSAAGDAASRAMLDRIHDSGRVYLTSTRLDGRFTLRMCVLSHRTHRDRVEEAVEIVREAATHVVRS